VIGVNAGYAFSFIKDIVEKVRGVAFPVEEVNSGLETFPKKLLGSGRRRYSNYVEE
jgi:hypothetical protein